MTNKGRITEMDALNSKGTMAAVMGYLLGVYICLAFNIFSVALLIPAVCIFQIFSDLRRQHRIRLHVQFFLSLTLNCIFSIVWYMAVHHDLLVNSASTHTVIYQNPVWCRIVSFMKIYFTSTTYFWMFCEGFYLHRLISHAFQTPESLIALYITGWIVPAIPVSIYAILRGVLANESCWVHSFGNLQWIIYLPNLVCLVMNLLFLSNILRILLFQLHSHPHEPSSFRRALKAAFMLIPLFGIQLLLTIYRPPVGSPGGAEAEYIFFFATSTQGAFVSLIFCFCNREVLVHLQKTCPCCICIKHVRDPQDYNTYSSTHFTSHGSFSAKHSVKVNTKLQTNGLGENLELKMLTGQDTDSYNSVNTSANSTPVRKLIK